MSKDKKQEPIQEVITKCSNADLDAQARLWKFLKTKILLNKIRSRIGNLYVDADDIFETAFMAFMQRIERKVFLPSGDSEAKQQNQVRNYFNQMINTSIRAYEKKKLGPLPVDEDLLQEQEGYPVDALGLVKRTLEVIYSTGELCSAILLQSLVYQKSNKEIAQKAFRPELTTTKALTEKRKDCLNRLLDHLRTQMKTFKEPLQKEYLQLAMEELDSQEEPCGTVLKLALNGSSNEEIAGALPNLLPPRFLKDLKTKEQIKRRKSRCFEYYREAILKRIFKNNKGNHNE